jgi:hypothetical protein
LKTVAFLLLTFLSSFGDTLFLAGIPLYLFNRTSSVSFSLLVPVVITITLLLVRPYLKKVQSGNQVMLVAKGELAMFAVEAAMILAHSVLQSPWVIIAGLVPLAAIYNSYAGAKFMTLPNYFERAPHATFSAAHSWCLRVGALVGALASGFLISEFGAMGLLLGDSISFLLMGGFLLLAMRIWKKDFAIGDGKALEIVSQKSPANFNIKFAQRLPKLLLSLIVFGAVTLTWERSTSAAFLSVLPGYSIESAGFQRAVWNFTGLMTGFILLSAFSRYQMIAWSISIFAVLLLGTLSFALSPFLSFPMMCFAAGFLGVLQVPSIRSAFKLLTETHGYEENFSHSFWPISSALGILLLPVGLLTDFFSGFSNEKLAISSSLLLTLGFPICYFAAAICHERKQVVS